MRERWFLKLMIGGALLASISACSGGGPSGPPMGTGADAAADAARDGAGGGSPDAQAGDAGADATTPGGPTLVAPPLDPSVSTTVATGTSFLYTGPHAIQTGVAPGAIVPVQAAVIRGRVLDASASPLPGVAVTVAHHAELGQTVTRADGFFDLAVNGGGPLTVDFGKPGLLHAQRQVDVPWQDFVVVPDVVLLAPDAQVTAIDMTASGAGMQVARGSMINDGDGQRQATVLFPAGTQSMMTMPDGTSSALATAHVRATEVTVGPNGPAAMPGTLPPSSAYTYAVDLAVDEATAAGASRVTFSQPVAFYLENFLGFATGGAVPVGYYDNDTMAWVASPDGLVVAVLDVTGGLATLDIDGSGQPAATADLATLGISDAERQQLASLYPPGQTLWRVPISHFTEWDCNWPAVPQFPDSPYPDPPDPPLPPPSDPNCTGGSIIECQTQALGERVAITGTPFTLNYRSSRMAGNRVPDQLIIPLSGDTVSANLKRIDLQIFVAGREFESSFPPTANQRTTFTWDGKDAYGRMLPGAQVVKIRIGYIYPAVYAPPGQIPASFGSVNAGKVTTSAARQEIGLWLERKELVQVGQVPSAGLGGWTVSVNHAYDFVGHTLYLGDGSTRGPVGSPAQFHIIAGGRWNGGDEGPAASAFVGDLTWGLVVGRDGTIYWTENNRVRSLDPSGIIHTFAGTGVAGFSGDGGPAAQAQLNEPMGLAVAPDGSLFVADAGNYRIRRIGLDHTITTVAGNGTHGRTGDEGPALMAEISVTDLSFSPDGSLYITSIVDYPAGITRRIDSNGIIHALPVSDIADSRVYMGRRSAWGPDGSLYTAYVGPWPLARIFPNGVTVQWGHQAAPALSIAVAPDGSVFLDEQSGVIERILPDQTTGPVAGTTSRSCCGGEPYILGQGGPALGTDILSANDDNGTSMGIAPDGSLIIARDVQTSGNILRVDGALPAFAPSGLSIASLDAAELYQFDENGRHVRTLNAQSQAVHYQFGYDGSGRLAAITDGDANLTSIERDAAGVATAIIAPGGQRTTLAFDANGFLAAIGDPAGGHYQMTYTNDGLLTTITDPNSHSSTMAYDSLGRLAKDSDAAGGSKTLTRTEASSGFTVGVTTALSRTTSYEVDATATGSIHRAITNPDGTTVDLLVGADGTQKTTLPGGATTTLLEGPDPRFSMQAPVASKVSVSSGGLTDTLSDVRTATLSNPADPLSATSVTDSVTRNGRVSSAVWNASSNATTVTTAANRNLAVTWDAQGRATQLQLGARAPIAAGYDSHGRLVSLARGDGAAARTVTFGYDAQGYLTSITDPLGLATGFAHDGAGRLSQRTWPDARAVAYSHDAKGNLTSLTPPGRPTHTFTYTPVDDAASYAPPATTNGPATTYVYDADRELTQLTRAGGAPIKFGYDMAGRISTQTSSAGATSYSYDATTGELTDVATPDGEALHYAYTGTTLAGVGWSGPVASTVSYSYDQDFRVSGVSVGGGAPVALAYDNDGFLVQAGTLTLTRDPQTGAVAASTLGVVTDAWTYNEFGEPTAYSASASGQPLLSSELTRDADGRIVQNLETIGGTTSTTAYGYDLAGRLTDVSLDGVPSTSYRYDPNGNRLTGATPADDETYDDQDRLLSRAGATFSYTASGELASVTSGAAATTYEYDPLGNLSRVTLPGGAVVDYVYDGENRRVGRKLNGKLVQGFIYQEELRPAAELDGTNAIVSQFVYATHANAPEYMIRGGITYRIITDQLGSPRLVVSAADGSVAQQMDFDEFGRVVRDTNPGFQPFGFAGGLLDATTGLIRFGRRDYDPVSGRWTSRDPLLFAEEETNLYLYADDDPVNLSDPSGLLSVGASAYDVIGGGFKVAVTDEGASACFELGFGAGTSVEIDPDGHLDGNEEYLDLKGSIGVGDWAAVGAEVEITPCKGMLETKSKAKSCLAGVCIDTTGNFKDDPRKNFKLGRDLFKPPKINLSGRLASVFCVRT
jgi:RHS repeat-associated protein